MPGQGEPQEAARVKDEKFTVLIVDDDRSSVSVLHNILKPKYAVLVAKSGVEALSRARERKPDLILLDIIMEDMDGFDVLEKLKQDDETRHIPVIFITALDSVEHEKHGFQLGAVDYITKPFHSSIVMARVKTHLQIVSQIRTIERLCLLDALTDLPNRRGFDERFAAEWAHSVREGKPLAMLVMDLDHFKQYNDSYGHPQGDQLLIAASHAFEAALKRQTDFCARVGGEEFAVLLPDTDLAGAIAVGENLRAAIERCQIALLKDETTLTGTTVSIGVSVAMPGTDDLLVALWDRADQACYRAKAEGRNRVCVWRDAEGAR
jgi:diguanylate cyclase (GGDEF)-like protein